VLGATFLDQNVMSRPGQGSLVATHTLTGSPAFRPVWLSLPPRLMMTVSPSLIVQSLPALSVRTNSFLSAWIPLTLPAAMASPATAGPARRTKAASALNHFEKLFMLSLPSSNLMARSPLTLKGRAFIRSTWDRTCFNSGGGRHQLGADRPARTSVDGVAARSTTLPACPHRGLPPPIW